MALGPKSVLQKMAVTRRRSNLDHTMAVPKNNLKPSGTFFEQLHATLDSQVSFFVNLCPPERDCSHGALHKIQL